MSVANFLDRIEYFGDVPAVVCAGETTTFSQLADLVRESHLLGPRIVAISGGYSLPNIVALLTQWLKGGVVALLGSGEGDRLDISEAEIHFCDGVETLTGRVPGHPLFEALAGQPGVILFTSGSSGTPKAVLHRVNPWLDKVSRPGRRQTTLAFLSFDHIGGLNTLLYALANGGTVVVPNDRSPSTIWQTIRDHNVELLPTTPTFLRLALLEGEIPALPSLKLIAYGSEPMPEATLAAARTAFPDVQFLQQYGMSELGVLRSRSRGDGSNWVRLGGSEFDLRVVDGLLEVRADTAMMGYLNAPSPFTEDGWLRTGDEAEQDGEWLRIRGRRNETINVGGEKVHPHEIEAVLESLPHVVRVEVRGEPNPLLGNVVVAAVQLTEGHTLEQFRSAVRGQLRGRLPRHAIPMRIELLSGEINDRFKKIRRLAA